MFHAFVLGLVQGLAEFLPISSSGHLVVVPWLFGWQDPGLGFDVALHGGTLLAAVIYFRNDILLILKGFWHSLFKSTRDLQNNIYQKLSWLLIIASVPGAIIGKLLESRAESTFRNPLLIAVTLGVMGIILYIADVYGKKLKNLNHISRWDALWLGVSQAVAIIPGVSRSGATMTAGLGLGFRREDAARFSFLMLMPISFGAGLLKIKDFHNGVTAPELVIGFVTSAVVGYLAIKFLLNYLNRSDFKVFAWYRIAAAVLIVGVYLARR
jgi:undecaprenyl-diphosphatase